MKASSKKNCEKIWRKFWTILVKSLKNEKHRQEFAPNYLYHDSAQNGQKLQRRNLRILGSVFHDGFMVKFLELLVEVGAEQLGLPGKISRVILANLVKFLKISLANPIKASFKNKFKKIWWTFRKILVESWLEPLGEVLGVVLTYFQSNL